jgi:acyl-CoA thioester hydrolase
MEYLIESKKVGVAAVGEGLIVILDYSSSKKVPLPLRLRENILQLQPELE